MTTFSTKFPSQMQKLRLANAWGGYVVHDGELMRIVSLHEADGALVACLVPARLVADADEWKPLRAA